MQGAAGCYSSYHMPLVAWALAVLAAAQLCIALVATWSQQTPLKIIAMACAFDTAVIAAGGRLLPPGTIALERFSRARYLAHALATSVGVHYASQVACRVGVAWAVDPWLQLHSCAGSVALLFTFTLREVLAQVRPLCSIVPAKVSTAGF